MPVSIVALTLNEIDGVKAILPAIRPEWYDQLIVVDGGSQDGTVEWCREHGYEIFEQRQRGIRYAYFEVLPHLTGDILVTISPDGNCDPSFIPQMVEKVREGHDLVIGSRYLGDAHSDDDDLITGFGNWLFTATVNLLHGGHYTDAMVIYRAFRRTLIDDLDLTAESTYALPEKLFFTKISWEPIMSVRALKARKRIAEVPAGEPARIGGKRKLQVFRWGAAFYFQFWRELWYWHPKPLNQMNRLAMIGTSDALAYLCLWLRMDYRHNKVDYNVDKDNLGEAHTNNIEFFGSLFNHRVTGACHHVSAKYLPL